MNEIALPGTVERPDGLTEREAEFVRHMLGKDIEPKEAARLAGYSERIAREANSLLLRKPHIQRAIHAEIAATIGTDGAAIAWRTMRDLMTSEATPALVRLQAAKWTLSVAGHIEAERPQLTGQPDKPLSEYSAAELERFIGMAKAAVSAAGQELRTIDAQDDAQLAAQAQDTSASAEPR